MGNTFGNVIGYYVGPRGLRMIPEATQRKLRLTQIQAVLERYGPWMAVISHWFGPLRTLFILYARTAGLRPLAYTACSFVGELTWTATWQVGLWHGACAALAPLSALRAAGSDRGRGPRVPAVPCPKTSRQGYGAGKGHPEGRQSGWCRGFRRDHFQNGCVTATGTTPF